MKKIILHIGKHKTGSTSFQLFLRKTRSALRANGIYPVPHSIGNQLAAVSIRNQLPIPPLLDMQHTGMLTLDEVAENVRSFIEGKSIETLLITSEHFSYFRSTEEIQRLRQCLPSNAEVFVYLVVRNPEDYRLSYRAHVKTTGHGPSDNPASPYYTERDSWLLDDEALINCWQSQFENFQVLDYTPEGMIHRLGSAMGLPSPILSKEYRLNTNSHRKKMLLKSLRDTLKKIPHGKNALRVFRKWRWG